MDGTVGQTPAIDALGSGSPFVGRTRELAALRAGLQETHRGHGRFFLITGEAGIGKTRLADELSRVAAESGAVVCWARCWEEGGAPAYLPWTQILRSYLRGRGADEPERQRHGIGSHIAVFVPELRGTRADDRTPSGLETEGADLALFDAVAELLVAAARDRALVLIFDDLHAADVESLRLLRFVSRSSHDVRLLLLGLYRPVEARSAAGVAEALQGLRREATHLPLGGLGVEEAAELVESIAGRPVPGALATAIQAHAEGNPLFVEEIVRSLAVEGRLDDRAVGALELPEAVGATIERRLERLSDQARHALSVAAVVGREFDVDLVSEVCGQPAERLEGLVREAARMGLVTEPGPTGRARFAHALFREALYREIPARRRAELHRDVAHSIEGARKTEAHTNVATLAHHWRRALPGAADPGRVAAFARRAGDAAVSVSAYDEAAGHYEDAGRLLEGAGMDAELGEVLLSLGEARWRAGDVDRGREAFGRAADLARALGDGEQFGRAALGYAAGFTVFAIREADERVIALLDEALAAVGARDSALRVRLLLRRALESYGQDGVETRDAPSRQALEIAERLGDRRVLLEAIYGRCLAIWGPDGVQERLALADRMLALAREAPDGEMSYLAHEVRYRTLYYLGDASGIDREVAACARLAEELRVTLYRDRAWLMRMVRSLWEGRLAETEEMLEARTRLLVERQHPGEHAVHLAIGQLYAQFFRGHLEEAAAGFRTIAERYPIPAARLPLLHALLELAPVQARAEFARIAPAGFALPKGEFWVFQHIPGLACAYLGERKHAEALYERLAPYADRVAFVGIGSNWGSVAHSVGLLAAQLGRWDEAIDHLERALERNLQVHRPFAAVVLRDHATVLLNRGAAGDADRAERLATQALELMDAMGMAGWRPSVERVLRRAAALRGPTASQLRRDAHGWTLTFEGASCRLADAKGLHYLAHLLARPHEQWHVLDLVGAVEGAPPEPGRSLTRRQAAEAGLSVGRLADAGAVLDPAAKRAYRERLAELEAERDRLREWRDDERVARLDVEIQALAHELTAAVGLGGRGRPAGSPAERARINVTRRIKHAIGEIAERCPTAGQHLVATIRTGWFCSYDPEPDQERRWKV